MNNTKVGGSGSPQVNQSVPMQETDASSSSQQVKTQDSQQQPVAPKLSEQNKSQLKNEQQITGAMKQAAIQGEFRTHGDLGTFSLTAGDQRVNDAKENARQLIREQLKQRENQAYAQEFSSINEIFKELSPQDKQALLNGPAPDPAKYSKGANDPAFMAELELYNKVLSS
jgi:hypothetical protein